MSPEALIGAGSIGCVREAMAMQNAHAFTVGGDEVVAPSLGAERSGFIGIRVVVSLDVYDRAALATPGCHLLDEFQQKILFDGSGGAAVQVDDVAVHDDQLSVRDGVRELTQPAGVVGRAYHPPEMDIGKQQRASNPR